MLHSLPHIAHTYVHTQSTSLVVFRTSFRFLTVRQLQLETHFIVANLTLLSHLINYRYYKPKPTSTPLSQPNPLFSPIRLTGSPVAPICPTGQSTFHLRPVRRSRDPVYTRQRLKYRLSSVDSFPIRQKAVIALAQREFRSLR